MVPPWRSYDPWFYFKISPAQDLEHTIYLQHYVPETALISIPGTVSTLDYWING
jgi:hypothetical protein